MAFTVTETKLILPPAGTAGMAILYGTYTNTGGSTGGDIKPGNDTTNVSGSAGLRKIFFVDITSSSATPSEPRIVTSFNSTQGGDIVTITTAADQTGGFRIEGEYVGQ